MEQQVIQLPDHATNIALVRNGIVESTIWGMIYSLDDLIEQEYDAIPYDDLLVVPGDTYENGHFYHDGEMVQSLIQHYENELAELEDWIIDELYNEIIENAEDLL